MALYMTKFFTMQLGKVNSNPVKAEVFGSDFPFYMSLSPLLWNIFYSRMKFFPVFQWLDDQFLKLVSAIFIKFLFFHQMIAFQKLWKMLFISSKKLFHSRDIQFFVFLSFPHFLPVGHCCRGWWKINLKVHDIISCLNKSSITHFVRYLEKEKRYDIEILSIDGVSDKECFYRKIMQKISSKSLSQSSL